MLKLELNPAGVGRQEYLAFLNACFPRQWNARLYDWYLARPFAGRRPDLLVLYRGDRAVAGSGINYRRLRVAGGTLLDVGIATGSWTLPAERGQGHFRRLMRESAELAASRGCPLFMAFVTGDNPSRQGFARLGATLLPSHYLHALPQEGARAAGPRLAPGPLPHPGLVGDAAVTSFHYESESEWRQQLLERPYPVESLALEPGCSALVECTEDTDRAQWLCGSAEQRARAVPSLVARARDRGRRFFLFSMGDWAARAASGPGIRLQPGAVACLGSAADDPALAAALSSSWDVQGGDRM